MRCVREVRETLSGCGTDPRRTLIGGIVNEKVKIVGFSEVVRENDLLLEVENRYPSAIESDPRLCSLGRELVENGGRHKLRKKSIHKQVQLEVMRGYTVRRVVRRGTGSSQSSGACLSQGR